MDVRITRLDPGVALPEYQTSGAAGFDLASSTDMTVQPGGHFLGIFARSSTPLKRGLMVANGVGVVDSDYCGATDEIRIEVLNFTAAPVAVARGDRLAQGVILAYARATWREASHDGRPARGGFGGTGH